MLLDRRAGQGFAALNPASVTSVQPEPIRFCAFQAAIVHEFTKGSAIDLCLLPGGVDIVPDTATLPGGDVAYPIHEALNWTVTRFGRQARSTFYAAILRNEDGSPWQVKLSTPRIDRSGKHQKYETPLGNGARAYFPPIPLEIRQRIAQRYGINIPSQGSFWDWLALHPEIPIVLTEGGKKALSLLSQGYLAIALYGVNGGYRKLDDGSRKIIDDLARFATPGRQITLGFDQDSKPIARRRVAGAISRFGGLLEQQQCTVKVAIWKAAQGKGVDDLIVNAGPTAWETAYRTAQPLLHWQIRQRLVNQLNYPVALPVATADLSSLHRSQVPRSGLIAIASPKGTGKTKLIAQMVADTSQSVAVGHRIALMRNLSARLNLDYKGDLDKMNGQFINGAAYTLRVGLCVDSLLAIDPEQFRGCDLILDEAVQVLRHLLTSSTCARDGMRPALLARLRDLVQTAERVILADADLDNATLHCIHELRGDDQPVFLIRNDQPTSGYPVRLLDAPDSSAIISDLLSDIEQLPSGQVLYISTDSKAISKTLAQLITSHHPEKRLLLINSETSGGECEREFICTPDTVLKRNDYDLILCSPSVGTGVSIEVGGIIERVYGLFSGKSATDADMAQALGRVRDPVERVVWCAKRGSNFSKVSRSTNPIELKNHLHERTSVNISLIRLSLRPDTAAGIDHYDWQSNPFVQLYCHISATQNYSMYHLRDALHVRLTHEGNSLLVEPRPTHACTHSLLASVRAQQKTADAEATVAAPDLTSADVSLLEQQEGLSYTQTLSLRKYYLKEFYCLDTLTLEAVLWDNEGHRRAEILNLEAQLYPALADERAVRGMEKQATWKQGCCPWDISHAPLRRALRSNLGLDELIAKICSGWRWTKYDLLPYAQHARQLAVQIKTVLNLTVTKMSDVQIVHQLLAQVGIHINFTWSQRQLGHEGEKLRLYHLDVEQWQSIYSVIWNRQVRRERLAAEVAEEHPDVEPSLTPLARTTDERSPYSLMNEKLVEGDPAFVLVALMAQLHRNLSQCEPKLLPILIPVMLKLWPSLATYAADLASNNITE